MTADTVSGLQKLFNLVEVFCTKKDLKCHTKNGRKLTKHEKWTYNSKPA
jgi:hypothetical protein